MNYKEALEKLQQDLPEVAEVIKAHVGGLNNESAERRLKLTEASKIVDAIKLLAGAENEDLIKFVKETKEKASSASTSVSALQAERDAALALASKHERLYIFTKAAQVSKADAEALQELLKDVTNDKIEVTADAVKVEGKPLSEYAETKGKFWTAALFNSTAPGDNPPNKEPLPTGGGKQPEVETNPALEFIDNQAVGIAAVFNARK